MRTSNRTGVIPLLFLQRKIIIAKSFKWTMSWCCLMKVPLHTSLLLLFAPVPSFRSKSTVGVQKRPLPGHVIYTVAHAKPEETTVSNGNHLLCFVLPVLQLKFLLCPTTCFERHHTILLVLASSKVHQSFNALSTRRDQNQIQGGARHDRANRQSHLVPLERADVCLLFHWNLNSHGSWLLKPP
jgi:hypothetical protein